MKFTETISVFSGDGIEHVDVYGNVTYEELPPVTVSGCVILPSTMDELHAPGRDWVLKGYDVYVPYAFAHLVDSTSRVRWDNVEWAVEGDVRNWKNPYTGTRFAVFRMERAEG